MMHKEEEDEDEDKNNNDYHDDYSHTHKHTQMNKLQKRDDACDSCCMVRYYFPPNPIILNMFDRQRGFAYS